MSVIEQISRVGASLARAQRLGRAELRELVLPSYHPERHYMRGPGPACARRAGSVQAEQVASLKH
jgi:hypothetical protein